MCQEHPVCLGCLWVLGLANVLVSSGCQVVKLRERILNSLGSNPSKSTQNFQLGRKCAMMPSGRQLVWSVPLFLRFRTVGESPMARYELLPPLLKVPSLIWYETHHRDGLMMSLQGVDPVHDPPKRAPRLHSPPPSSSLEAQLASWTRSGWTAAPARSAA